MATNQLARYELKPLSLDDTFRLGDVFAKSGFFQDTRGAAQCAVKILAGSELGFGPMASMKGIHIIQNQVALSANLIAAAIKRSGRYNYRVLQMSDDIVEIEYFEAGESIGVSTFTRDDAIKAGTKNMQKFPRNMLFARAMSNGARWYCPDVFNGSVYTPEELGADVDEEGEIVNAQPVDEAYYCDDCGEQIKPSDKANARQIANWTRKMHGRQLCADCARKLVAIHEPEEQQQQAQPAVEAV